MVMQVKNLSFIAVHTDNTFFFLICGSAVFFLFGVQIFFFFLNKWHILSQIHSYIFIRPLEKVLTFKVLPLQVGFYDAEILVSLDPLSKCRIVKSPQCTISNTFSCTFCLLFFTWFKGFSVRNTTLRDNLSPESWQRLSRLWGEKNKTKLISIPFIVVPGSFFLLSLVGNETFRAKLQNRWVH